MERGADRGVDLLPSAATPTATAPKTCWCSRGGRCMRSLADGVIARIAEAATKSDDARRRRRGRRALQPARRFRRVRRRRRRRHRRARPPGRGGDGRELGRDPSRRGRRGRARSGRRRGDDRLRDGRERKRRRLRRGARRRRRRRRRAVQAVRPGPGNSWRPRLRGAGKDVASVSAPGAPELGATAGPSPQARPRREAPATSRRRRRAARVGVRGARSSR